MSETAHPILVSDDSADVLILYRLILENKGGFTNVQYVSNAAEVIRICQRENIALIITDISKPGMDGFEMVARLRDDPTTRGIPVMFSTTRSDVESRQRAAQLGVNEYLIKPFTASQLLERVRALLAHN